jgi:hypothetical protein
MRRKSAASSGSGHKWGQAAHALHAAPIVPRETHSRGTASQVTLRGWRRAEPTAARAVGAALG